MTGKYPAHIGEVPKGRGKYPAHIGEVLRRYLKRIGSILSEKLRAREALRSQYLSEWHQDEYYEKEKYPCKLTKGRGIRASS